MARSSRTTPARRKAATKATGAKKAGATKAGAKKPAAKKPVAKKATATKPTAKKAAATKPTAKKVAATKPTAKKAAATKPAAKKPAAKKATAKKATATKPAAKPSAATQPVAPGRLDDTAVRRIALFAQGLVVRPPGTLAQIVAATGYLRTLGGIEAYVALRARRPTLTRATIDLAVGAGELRVVPAMRGCMYLVPERHVDRCLALAESLTRVRDDREAERAGIREAELDQLAAQVLVALRDGPATTDGLRKRLPDGAVRSLGAAGKKLGISSPLPMALRRLEFAGAIVRAPERDRVDTERYAWRKRRGVPELPTAAQLQRELARSYYAWAGVGTVPELAAWSGLSQRDAEAATDAAGVPAVTLADGTRAFADPEARAWAEREVDTVALLPFEDNLVALAGGPARWIAREHLQLSVPVWGSKQSKPLGDARHLALRTIVAGDRIVGFWEYDPGKRDVVTALLGKPAGALVDRVEAAAAELGSFVREEVGHGRSFSLDTDEALRERVAALRKLVRR
ncbi:MAG: winged helix DNA-binding domain-containing protein [Nannocystaceae bacterium]|nr:winged helix DNA-binding domain-containing protein [Nannocystaceae bacterium]